MGYRWCLRAAECDLAAGSFEKNPVLILKKAIETANDSIRKNAAEDISYEGMGNPDKNKVGVPTSMNRSAG